MKKLLTLLLSVGCLYAGPVSAHENTPMVPMDDALPASMFPIEALSGLQSSTNSGDEVSTEQRRRRRGGDRWRRGRDRWGYRQCPRGYRLIAYRTRIGPIVVVRYRCVRYGYRY